MHRLTFEPARPIDTDSMPWIPTGPGKSFRPLRFAAGSWSELMRLEPGSAVAVHRHTGEVHAFNLTGTREIFGTGERVGPGSYVYEPAGTIDGWAAIGDEPCVVHIKVTGAIEYLGENGQVIESITADTQARGVPELVPGAWRAPGSADSQLTRRTGPPEPKGRSLAMPPARPRPQKGHSP